MKEATQGKGKYCLPDCRDVKAQYDVGEKKKRQARSFEYMTKYHVRHSIGWWKRCVRDTFAHTRRAYNERPLFRRDTGARRVIDLALCVLLPNVHSRTLPNVVMLDLLSR